MKVLVELLVEKDLEELVLIYQGSSTLQDTQTEFIAHNIHPGIDTHVSDIIFSNKYCNAKCGHVLRSPSHNCENGLDTC
jgi:hypothetical protein